MEMRKNAKYIKTCVIKAECCTIILSWKKQFTETIKKPKNYHGIHAHGECVRVIDDLF